MSIRSVVVICALLAAAACGNVSETPADAPNNGDGPPQVACTSAEQCPAATPVCDLTQSVCVQCTATDIGVCAGTTPVCSPDETCRACSAHTECASAACLPDGSCASEADVAYVDAAAAGSATCTKAAPCNLISAALATTKTIIKVHGTVDEPVAITDRNTTFLADDGATLRSSTGDGLTIKGTSHVEIYDLTIDRATSGIHVPTGTTVQLFLSRAKVQNNRNGGIVMESGTLTVTGSTIANNTGAGGIFSPGATLSITTTTFAGNSGGQAIIVTSGSLAVSRSTFLNNLNGGLSLTPNGTFQIVGNVFFNNGRSTDNTGGISINTQQFSTGNRLELNTFLQNTASSTTAGAIACTTASPLTARSNIMSSNTLTSNAQFSGNCTHAYSIVLPGNVPTGTGNLAMDPAFIDAATGNVHLTATSPARGAGDPATDLNGIAALDLDGDQRTAPPDIGADQFKP
jgi:parallel beta helix pectate lyase-like protein